MMNNRKRVKTALSIAIIGAFGLLAVTFGGYRYFEDNKAEVLMKAAQNADLSLKGLKHTATKNGKTEWSLEAAAASFDGDAKEAYLNDVSLVFFRENGKKIFVKAEHGTLKTDLNDILLKGNVVVQHDGYTLKTDTMNYVHKEKNIFSRSKVRISGDMINMTADSIRLDMGGKLTVMEGHVKGEIVGNLI